MPSLRTSTKNNDTTGATTSTATKSTLKKKKKGQGKKKQSKPDGGGFSSSVKTTEKKEKSIVRNEKAKNAGAKLGGFLRASLSRSRSKSRSKSAALTASSADTNTATTVKEPADDQSILSRTSRSNGLDCSRRSSTSRRSERTERSISIHDPDDEVWPVEAYDMSLKDDDDFNSGVTQKEEKPHSEAREKLLLESRLAIERKQNQARMRGRSKDKKLSETAKLAAAMSLSSSVGSNSNPKQQNEILESHSSSNSAFWNAALQGSTSSIAYSGDELSRDSSSQLPSSDDKTSPPAFKPKKKQASAASDADAPRRSKTRSLSTGGVMATQSKSQSQQHARPRALSTAEAKSRSKSPSARRTRSRSMTKSEARKARSKSLSQPHARPRSLSMAEAKARSKSPSIRRTRSGSMSKTEGNAMWSEAPLPRSGPSGADSEWHTAILKHEWTTIEKMLRSYDYTKYRESGKQNKPETQLRIMKFLSKNTKQTSQQNNEAGNEERDAIVSPLLQVDSMGRTPLHCAIKEHMPSMLLQRLYFVERGATGVQDEDGRYPLHLALINNLDQKIVDRFIRSYPGSLGMPDNLNRTPIQYAVLKAEYFRDKDIEGKWCSPTSKIQEKWQKQQMESWQVVDFLLETMITRNKPLCSIHERNVLLESFEFYAPPSVVNKLLTTGGRFLLKDIDMAKSVLALTFASQYPVSIMKRVIRVTSKAIPSSLMLHTLRQELINHFTSGVVSDSHETSGCTSSLAFVKDLLQCYRIKRQGGEAAVTTACLEWWEKLRFLIAYSSCRFDDDTEDIILHAALTNPQSPPALIEFLCRLLPSTKYEIDANTGALPLHVACVYWDPVSGGDQNETEYVRILNILTAGDFTLVQSRYKERLAVHHAILSGKPLPFIRPLLALDNKTAIAPDPVTNLFPFQLAACPRKTRRSEAEQDSVPSSTCEQFDTEQLNLIFELLRVNPYPISILTVCHYAEMSPLTRHTLLWCYDWGFSGWKLSNKRKDMIRLAIEKGKIPEPMKSWWTKLKTLIWRAYNELDAGGQKGMRETPQTHEYLLHAALWNSSKIPPIVIELIIEMYPPSIYGKEPGTGMYPIHIAAQSQSYQPFSFENTISMSSVLEMITLLHPDGLSINASCGRLPLHMAVASGKTWDDIRSMIDIAPEALSTADPCTGLFLFHLCACKDAFIPSHVVVQNCRADSEWGKMSPEENALAINKACKGYDLKKLDTIFEILRARPKCLDGGLLEDNNDKSNS